MKKTHLTTGQYAARLGVCIQRVKQLLKEGRIQGAQKIGGRYIIPVNAPDPRRPHGRPKLKKAGD